MASNQRLTRLIDLVPFISKHQGIPVAELAKIFGVSVSEIEKDLWLLYMCGLPGQTPLELMEFEFEDGFVTVRNADELKTPRTLTQTEIAILIIGLEILASRGSQSAEKLKFRLVERLNNKVEFQPSVTELLLPEISDAIQKNRVLSIKYLGKSRDVIPFEIYQEGNSHYLRAYCKSASDRRTFKISKIESLKTLELSEVIPNQVPSISHPLSTKIKVHHSARRVRELFGSIDEIQYFSTEWLLSEVMAMGAAVELLDPQLQQALKARIQASQNQYL